MCIRDRVPVVEKPQQSKKLVFSEIYMNDVPEAVMDRLAREGAMIKQAFMAYGIDPPPMESACSRMVICGSFSDVS